MDGRDLRQQIIVCYANGGIETELFNHLGHGPIAGEQDILLSLGISR